MNYRFIRIFVQDKAIIGFQIQEFYIFFLNEPRNEQKKNIFVIYFKLDYGIWFSTVFLSISSLL